MRVRPIGEALLLKPYQSGELARHLDQVCEADARLRRELRGRRASKLRSEPDQRATTVISLIIDCTAGFAPRLHISFK